MMRIIFLAPLLFSLLTASSLAQTVFFFAQVGDGTVANIKFQTTLIFVNTSADSQVTVEFFKSDGQPMQLILSTSEGQMFGPDPFTISLGQGQAFSAQTPGTGDPQTGDLQVGYARVTSTGSGVGGTAVFTRSDPDTGTIVYDAGVPAAQTLNNFSLFTDSLQNKDTGLAMVNPPGGLDANLTLQLRDKSFSQIATTDLPLASGQHLPKFIREIFDDPLLAAQVQEMEGVVTVQSDEPLAAVTLRQNEDALTAFPVVPGTALPAGTSGSFTLLSTGEVSTSLDLSFKNQTVIGVIYRLYGGQVLLGEVTRGILSLDRINHVLPVDRAGHRVSRVEAQLIYAGGHLSSSFELLPN
ncbi:hypothetical protein MYX84_09770 [Acidobacteria bacterium AH-259-O06]|nr:hypothetical protein [Acidobacteria bacterium AH-259-O06]